MVRRSSRTMVMQGLSLQGSHTSATTFASNREGEWRVWERRQEGCLAKSPKLVNKQNLRKLFLSWKKWWVLVCGASSLWDFTVDSIVSLWEEILASECTSHSFMLKIISFQRLVINSFQMHLTKNKLEALKRISNF